MTKEIPNLSEVYLEISSSNGRCRYRSMDNNDDGGISASDFIGPEQVWIIERQKGEGNIIAGDLLWVKNKYRNKYVSHGIDGAMMRLIENKGKDELWAIGDGRHGIPVQSGQPTLFPLIYRGCIWLTGHLNETETIIRILGGRLAASGDGIPLVNHFGKEIKLIFDNGMYKDRVNINVQDGRTIFLSRESEYREISMIHYYIIKRRPYVISRIVILKMENILKIVIEKGRDINIIRSSQ